MAAFTAYLNRLRLSTKVTLMTVGALILLSSVTFIGTRMLIMENARDMSAERLDTNMRVAESVLGKLGHGFSVHDGALYAGDVKLNGNEQAVDEIKGLVGGIATIFQGDMRVATNVKKEDGSRAVGTPLAAGPARDAAYTQGVSYRGPANILGESYLAAYDPIKDANGKVIGVLSVGMPAKDYFDHANHVGLQGLGIAAIITLIAAFLCMRAATMLFRPLENVTGTMKRLSEGDNSVTVEILDRDDEIGNITRALGVFRETAIAKQTADREQAMVVDRLTDGLDKLAAGDLTADIENAFPVSYEGLRANFNAALANLRELIGAASDSAASIRQGSHEIAQASEDLARRTEGNAASLEQSSAALVEIDSRLKTSADAAARTVARADQAISTVGGGRTIAGEAVQAMGRVSESAKDIDSVIEGLDKIAFQTRVLAMNAAVEAGRAGEAGRGFAVVADLVSALAMRSEEEAKLAREQLTLTQAGIVTAVDAVHKVDGAFADISSDVQQVHELLGGMAADNQAQSTAISQITVAVGTMNQSTQQNAAMVEETSAAARNLTGEVEKMTAQTARFTVIEGRRPVAAVAPVSKASKLAVRAAPKPTYVSPVKALPQAAPAMAGGDAEWDAF